MCIISMKTNKRYKCSEENKNMNFIRDFPAKVGENKKSKTKRTMGSRY